MNALIKKILNGKLNTDDDILSVNPEYPQGDYLDSENTRLSSISGENNSRISVLGNEEKENPFLPEGDNFSIGRLEHNGYMYVFNWNSENIDGIYRYNGISEEWEELVIGDFGFQKTLKIHSANIINDLLYWTDGKYLDGIQGNGLRCVNIKKAVNRLRAWNIIFEPTQVLSADLTFVAVTLTDPLGVATTGFAYPVGTTYKEWLQSLANGLNAVFTGIEFKGCECEIEAEMIIEGKYTLTAVGLAYTGASVATLELLAYAENFYPEPIKIQHIDRAKYSPLKQPDIIYGTDLTRKQNYINDKYFQFAVQYEYDNNEISPISPVSRLAFGEPLCGISFDDTSNNYIKVDFTDTRLNDVSDLAILKRVNLLVRFGYLREWRLVKTMDRCDFNIAQNTFDFYNDGNYPVWAFTEFRQNIPLVALSQEFVNNRGYIGGTKEGEDNIDCLDVGTELTYEEGCEPQQFGSVYAKIKIRSPLQPTYSQVIWDKDGTTVYGGIDNGAFSPTVNPEDVQQEIPLAGFLIYAVGTPYAAASRQINPGGALPTIAGEENIFDVSTAPNTALVYAAMIADSVYSEVTLNLPPGRHILRIASCQIGPEKAGLYKYPGGGYQRTSTYLKGFPTNAETSFSNTCEIIVDVLEGVETDIGTIEVYDLTYHAVFHGYCLDSEGDFEAEDVINGAQVEMLSVVDTLVNPEISCFGDKGVTDPNGYFFLAKAQPIFSSYNPLFGAGAFRNTSQNYFNNSLNYLYINETGTVATSSAVTIGVGLPVVVYSVNNPGLFSEQYRTVAEGLVIDSTGNPVPGMTILCCLTGRVFTTDGDGRYEALVYADFLQGVPLKRTAYLIARPSAACCIEFISPVAGEEYNLNFIVGIGTTYTFTNHFFPPDFVMDIEGLAVELLWKHRNTVELGIVYLDETGRRTTVQESENFVVEIPAITDTGGDIGRPVIEYSISHTPPTSAVKYMIVRKLNPYYTRYLQFIVGEIQYVSLYDAAAEPPVPITTSFGAGDAKEIYMSLIPILNYGQENTGSIISYIPEKGDRVLFLRDADNNVYEGYFDFEISQRGDNTVASPLQLIIKNNASLPELLPGTFVEMYTPKKQIETDFYYEFGQCWDIVDGLHQKGEDGENQTISTPATGFLYGGDTFVRTREMFYLDGVEKNFFVRKCEDEYISDFDADSKQQSIGHPDVADPNEQQYDHFSRIRVSDVISANGNKLYNGLSTFEYGLYNDADRTWGAVNKLVRVGEKHELLAIQSRKIQPVYVGLVPIESLADEGSRTVISDTLINIYQPFKSPYGSQNPESIVQEGNSIWGYDRERALFWWYALNDPANISEELAVKVLVQQITTELEDFNPDRIFVVGGIDRRNREVVWAFQEVPAVEQGPGSGEGEDTGDGGGILQTGRLIGGDEELVFSPKTLAWSYKRNEWETRYSYAPEVLGSIGEQRFFTAKAGKLYLHDKGDACTFYGVKYPARIKAPICIQPNIVKDWYGGRIKSIGAWSMTEIVIPANNTFKLGMRSRMTENNYTLDEGDRWFSFLADMSDPNFNTELEALYDGRSLKGGVIVITFENNDTTQASLDEIAIKISPSMETL